MLNVACCDDDYIFLQNIGEETKKVFEALKVQASIALFTDANLLVEKFEQRNPYDIVFLDIFMPFDGLDVAKRLRQLDRQFKLIFISEYEAEVFNTFQYHTCAFLPKTHIEKDLGSLIQRVVNEINENDFKKQLYSVKKNNGDVCEISLPINDIEYFECVNRKIFLHTNSGEYLLYGCKFTELIDHYKNECFVDIHRTCIVNVNYIGSIGKIEVTLEDGTILPLSRRKRQAVIRKFLCEVKIW